jgi:hypothetical protein
MTLPIHAYPYTQKATPALFSGRVVSVDVATGAVDVVTDGPMGTYYSNCELVSPVKANRLGGLDYLPQVGDVCILLENLSTGQRGAGARAMIIGYRSMNPISLSSRVELLPGDVRIQGATGSDLLLRNNGDIYVVSDSQTMMAFLSTEEIVRLRSASYEHTLQGGAVQWTVTDGGAVSYLMGIKGSAADAEPYLTVSGGSEGALTVTLHMAGAARGEDVNPYLVNNVEASAGFKFHVDAEGHVAASAAGTWQQESADRMVLSSATSVSAIAPELFLYAPSSGGVTLAKEGPMVIDAPRGLVINAPFITLRQTTPEPPATLHSDATEESKYLLNVDLLQWLFNHVHLVMPVPPATPSCTTAPVGTPPGGSSVDAAGIRDGLLAAVGQTPAAPALAAAQPYAILDDKTIQTQDTRAR